MNQMMKILKVKGMMMGVTLFHLLAFSPLNAHAQSLRKECGTVVAERIFGKPAHRAGTRGQKIGEPGKFMGERKGLIILMEFSNQKFIRQNNSGKVIDPHALWNDIANKEGLKNVNGVLVNGSIRDYFHDQSYGQFELDFDVVGPYLAKNKYQYYGRNATYANGEFDQNPAELIVEACEAASKEVNFKDYDWNDDGEVEQVYVVYAGYGEADSRDSETIWPHKSFFTNTLGAPLIIQDMIIDTYACSNELNPNSRIDGLGSICHEFSHCLGLPDVYDTRGNNSLPTPGSFDIMDSGNYNGESWYPSGFSSFERYFCGWLEPKRVKSLAEANLDELSPLHLNPDAYLVSEIEGSTNYFMVENREKKSWDKFLPSHGLIAWHINYDLITWTKNDVNVDPNNMGILVVPLEDVPGYGTTAIMAPEQSDRQPVAWYNLNGRSLQAAPQQRGIYIVRYADGSMEKVKR
jgi:M6 family metalloprotease-like protein